MKRRQISAIALAGAGAGSLILSQLPRLFPHASADTLRNATLAVFGAVLLAGYFLARKRKRQREEMLRDVADRMERNGDRTAG